MESIRKWFYRPKRDDTSLLAQFFYANEALTAVACELDSFDGRQEPERCTTLVNQLRHCQDKVLTICNQIMDELIPDCRANRDFRVKFPDDVMQENLAGQLWFGAECLAAGSSIMNREVESSAMRPLAKALTKSLEIVRNLLREHALKGHMNLKAQNPMEAPLEKLIESLKIFDRLFADFELCYVAAMVPVKSTREYEQQELVCVLFSETLQRALERGLLSQADVDNYEPALMFTIPRLAIVAGLLAPPGGPLCLDSADNISEMFRPFRNLLLKIRELLWTLNSRELYMLEKLLCSNEEPSAPISQSGKTACQQDFENFVQNFYTDYPNCKDFMVDFYTVTRNTGSNMDEIANDAVAIIDQRPVSRIEYLIDKKINERHAREMKHNAYCTLSRARSSAELEAVLQVPPPANAANTEESQDPSHQSPSSSGSGPNTSARVDPEPFLTADISQILGTSGNIEIPQTQYLLNQVSHENNVVTGEHIHVDNSLPDMDSKKLISEANKTLSSLLLEGDCPHEIVEQTDSGICTVISSENTSLYDKSPEEKKTFAGDIQDEPEPLKEGAALPEEPQSSCPLGNDYKCAECEEYAAQVRSYANRAATNSANGDTTDHKITLNVNGNQTECIETNADSQGRSDGDRFASYSLKIVTIDPGRSSSINGKHEDTTCTEPEPQDRNQPDKASANVLKIIPKISTTITATTNPTEEVIEEQPEPEEPTNLHRAKNTPRISSSFNGTNEEFVGLAYGNGQLTVCDSNPPAFQINYSENWENLNMNIERNTNEEPWRERKGPSTSQNLKKITNNVERVPSRKTRENKLRKRQRKFDRKIGKRVHDDAQRSLSCGVRVVGDGRVRMSPSTESSRSNSTDRGLNPRLRSFGVSLHPSLNTRQMPNFGSQSPQRSPRLCHFEARASRKLLDHRRSRSEQLARMRKRRSEELVNDGLGPRTDKSGLACELPPTADMDGEGRVKGNSSRGPMRPTGVIARGATPSIEQPGRGEVASSSSYSSYCDSSSETSEFQSDCQDDEEIALAMQAAEIANRNQIRAKFRSSEDLVHRLFVCIAGVADQLQTNFASDLRNILKCVFLMNSTASDESNSTQQTVESERLDTVESLNAGGNVERQDSLQEDEDDVAETNNTNERTSPVTERGVECVERAPAWIPDTDAPRCMACHAGFTVVRRRHHCRNCGKVFCGRCSSNSVPLPRYGHTKPVRVCNRCFLYQVTPFTVSHVAPSS